MEHSNAAVRSLPTSHWLTVEKTIITTYQSGMSSREMCKFIERVLGNPYFPESIFRITDVVKEDIEK
jgi:putative transposase